MDETYDVVVIGGGAAGLSGALALARSRRSVLVLDAGEPRNAPAGHVHNFLTRDGTPPADLYDAGRAEVLGYGGHVEKAVVSAVHQGESEFLVEADGKVVSARRLLVATGLRDVLPDVPGIVEGWGNDVLHCPYCHGWEVRDRRVGVLCTGPMAVHQALLFRQLTEHVTFLQHTGPALSDDDRDQLAALQIPVVPGEVLSVDRPSGLPTVRVAGSEELELDALVVAPTFEARAEALAPLGLSPSPFLMGEHVVGTRIEAGFAGATAVPGVWAVGNVAEPQAQVISSAAAGLLAGAAINADLVAEDAKKALMAYQHSKAAWEERYQAHSHLWSGQPNAVLVAELADLSPGTALDAGCGEGADACWLAERGWKVTGADLSATAIARAREHAAERGVDVTFTEFDVTVEDVPGAYDLVTSHFLHFPKSERDAVFSRLAAAVKPGGTLLIVGHDLSDVDTSMPRHHLADRGWDAGELAAWLGEEWEIDVAEPRSRQATDPEGREVTIHDAVVRARRR